MKMSFPFGWAFRMKLIVFIFLLVQLSLYHDLAECKVSQARRDFKEDFKALLSPAQKVLLPIGEALIFNEDLSTECTTALLRTGRALRSGKMWATRMLVSNGFIPENIFLGQTQAHGSIEQCLRHPELRDEDGPDDQEAHYCKVKLAFSKNDTFYERLTSEIHKTSGLNVQAVPDVIKGIYTGLVASLCVPRDCSEQDVQIALNTISDMYGLQAEVSSCQNGDPPSFETQQILTMAFFGCILILCLAGTIIELNSSIFGKSFPGRFIRCFGLSKNWTSLLDGGDPQHRTGFFNGLKLLLCLWISAGHLIIFPSPEFTQNPGDFFMVVSRSLWFQLFSNINLAVVGFFFISGYLVHHGTERFSTKQPFRYVLTCFARRYFKLVIPALVVLLTTLLYPLMSRTASPREGFYFNNIGSCSREWYLLPCLSNNYIDIFREQCLTHLWYISTDLKIYPLVVALSVFYRRSPRYALITCLLVVSLTSVFVGIETFREGASGVVARADLEGKRYLAAGKALDLYTRPYTQVAAYVMGMLCAVLVETLQDRPPNFTTFAKSLLWILSGTLFLIQTYLITYSSIQVFSPAGIGMSIYAGVSRPLHALMYLWIVTACTLYFAEPLRRFLSHPVMFALGKLSYGVYLIHFPLGSLGYANLKNASLQYNFVTLSQGVLGTLMQSFILAAILYIFVEKPLANVDRLLVNRRRRTNSEVNKNASSLPATVSKDSSGLGCVPIGSDPETAKNSSGTTPASSKL
ncbi:O-acyltransferase like protein [Galendromus occidentalis]|uniref:O-acyltransferase like protein n=1 Tax=Galendromus occidentalis TaxID=34638 RepID=A0AAJ6QVF4_9ACAR|nr:O-acyltransferase like protein [Galendromus occidentalis]